jgi:hypothetical protein
MTMGAERAAMHGAGALPGWRQDPPPDHVAFGPLASA